MVKEEQNLIKVTSAISANCAHNLKILSAYLQLTLSETINFVLEKNVASILERNLTKFLEKKVKSIEGTE